LKLEILTCICDAGNALVLLSELGEYVRSPDTTLAVVAIQAIGRLSNKVPSVSETCLEGLMTLVQQKNPAIVGESVVVIKRLLQTRPREQNTQHICTLIYNLEYVVVPLGKSSILWLVGQYADLVPQYAPDILRQFCKTFKEEEVSVKLQILTLASKLLTSLPQEPMVPKLFDYVIQLARYDVDYDLRDRARFLRGFHHLNEPKDGEALDVNSLSTHLKTILLSEKSAPKYLSSSEGKEHFTIGSASLQVGHKVNGYEPLPEWPTEKPDGSLRSKGASSWTGKSTASVSTPSPAIGQSKTSPTSHTSFVPKSITPPKQYANDLDAFYDDVDMDSNPLRTSNIRESYESEEESDEDEEEDGEEESEYETDEEESEYEETEDDSEEESEYSSDSEVEGQHLLKNNRR
jgi:AP-3 complex subunit beta